MSSTGRKLYSRLKFVIWKVVIALNDQDVLLLAFKVFSVMQVHFLAALSIFIGKLITCELFSCSVNLKLMSHGN